MFSVPLRIISHIFFFIYLPLYPSVDSGHYLYHMLCTGKQLSTTYLFCMMSVRSAGYPSCQCFGSESSSISLTKETPTSCQCFTDNSNVTQFDVICKWALMVVMVYCSRNPVTHTSFFENGCTVPYISKIIYFIACISACIENSQYILFHGLKVSALLYLDIMCIYFYIFYLL